MFKPVTMSEVNIVVLNKDITKVTDLLYDLRLMEFFKVEHKEFQRHEQSDLGELSKEVLEIRSIISFLKSYYKNDSKNIIKDPIKETREWMERQEKNKRKILHLNDELNRFEVKRRLKIKDSELGKDNIKIGYLGVNESNRLKDLQREEIRSRKVKLKDRIYFIAFASKLPFSYTEFYIPKELEENLTNKLNEEHSRKEKIEIALEKIANGNLKHLESEEARLTKYLSSLEVKSEFLKTANISILNGFVPQHRTKRVRRELEKLLGNNFEMMEKEVKKDAPIMLDHGSVSNNFTALLKMYSLPKYKEIDPTLLMLMVFPIFYGYILGDVIYGLISLAFFTALKFKLRDLKEFLSILQISSISSIIFGVIFGEFMGFELHGAYYGFIERSHEPELLLIIALIFGLIHINLALILGFINHIKHLKHAITHSLSWIIMEIGVAGIAWGMYSSQPIFTYLGIPLTLIGVALIYMGHGFIGLIEIPSFFTNIFSYARLMAVGLSSVAIAILINEYSVPLFSSGIFGIIAAIILFTLGHIFNIVLGNFESFLHTLRLHYVEFFTKFYEGGGKEFTPFGRKQEF